MAQTFHMNINIGGTDLQGSTTQDSSGGIDRAGSGFECYYFEQSGEVPMKGSSGIATGRRNWGPLKIRKVVDGATPLLVQGFAKSERVESFELLFFRPSDEGGGAEHNFKIHGTNGRIRSHRIVSPDSFMEGDTNLRMYEEFEIVCETEGWDEVVAATSTADTWREDNA